MTQTVLHYTIREKIGVGGMGSVYLAEDTKLDRKVALKFLSDYIASDESQRERFKTEARAAAALNHPNIAQIHAIEEEGDELFIVMEYLEGTELKKAIASGSLSTDDKIRIALQVAEALQAAHAKGVVHRDVKSGNVMIDGKGNAKIMDFGLARIQGSEHITKTGATLGTPAYMSPEQVHGDEIDARSDIWSYGVVLYELFTGDLPFKGVYEPAILYAITENEPEAASSINADIPEYIERIIHKCLQKNREKRYQNMGTIIGEIESRYSGAPHPAELVSRFDRSRMAYTGLGLAVLVVLALFVLTYSMSDWLGPRQANALPSKPNLAILPIDNIGGDSTYQAICEGLHETLSGKVSQVERYRNQFSLTPSSEVRNRNIRTAGEARELFGINLAVMSSMQPISGDSTRLIMNLVDAGTIHTLDSKIIDVPSNNLAALQNQGVSALLEMLGMEMNPEIERAIRKGDPARPGASDFYIRGRAYLHRPSTRENIDTAIRLFKRAVEEDSTYALAYAALGESYWRRYREFQDLGDVDSAKVHVEIAIQLKSDLAPVKITQGIINRGTGNADEAIRNFRQALEIDPTNFDAFRQLATSYQEQGRLDDAENTYKEAIWLKPDLWIGYSNLGSYYLINGQYEEAVEQYRYVTELTPDSYVGYNGLGASYLQLGESDKAKEMFEMSLARDTTLYAASNLGTLNYLQKEYAQAANWYKVALNLAPNDLELWGFLANASEMVPNMNEEAGRYYRKAIEIGLEQLKVNPNNSELMARLGSYYSVVGDTTKAYEFIEKALAANPENLNIKLFAVVVYEELGERKMALKWVDKRLIPYMKELGKLENLVKDRRFQEMVNDTL